MKSPERLAAALEIIGPLRMRLDERRGVEIKESNPILEHHIGGELVSPVSMGSDFLRLSACALARTHPGKRVDAPDGLDFFVLGRRLDQREPCDRLAASVITHVLAAVRTSFRYFDRPFFISRIETFMRKRSM